MTIRDRLRVLRPNDPDSYFCFFGFGIGVMNATLRRSGRIRFVGWPLASSSLWRDGYS